RVRRGVDPGKSREAAAYSRRRHAADADDPAAPYAGHRYPAGHLPTGLPLRPGVGPPFAVFRQRPMSASGAEGGIAHPQSREVRPIETAIPCQESIRLHAGVRTDQEIGDDPAAVTSLPRTVLPPEAAGERRRFWAERVEADSEHTEGVGATLIVREPGSHLGPHHRARNEGTLAIGRAQ